MTLREVELFQAVYELDAAAQDAYLNERCAGDDALRSRVRRLLEAHRVAERQTLQLIDIPLPAETPDAIGPYRIVRTIGEGGMGIVYEAEQLHPVQRRVAVKVMKPGNDTTQVVARFTAERQAVAAMDHPYVAKMFDAGETAAGRPFFVMELIQGEPLLDFCSRTQLTIRERVALFVSICQAVQHAHTKGLIHRDLKPSNLLVTATESGPVPKVIDFGVARALDGDSVDVSSRVTRDGQAVGTPAYMSPEQAGCYGRAPRREMPLDIDARTDIYSLGVVLYELITGELPADPDSTGQAAFLVQLASGDLNIPRPSVRARTMRSATTAAQRIPEDLDWIVMKALEPDRTRRYETAFSMAEDLTRYLRNEPVSARPPALAYRVRKFVARNKVSVAAAAVALLAVLGGATAAAVGYVRAVQAEARAREEATTARRISEFLTDLFAASDPNLQATSTLREVMDRGAARIEQQLKDEPEVQASLLNTMSHAYGALGIHQVAVDLAEKSLALDAAADRETLQTAEAALTLGRSSQDLGDFERAQAAYERVLEIRTRLLGENHLEVAEAWNYLGSLHGQLERHEEAIAAHEKALAIQQQQRGMDDIAATNSLRGLAIIYARQKDPTRALGLEERVLRIYRKHFGEVHTVTGAGYQAVAASLRDLKRIPESRAAAEKALEIWTRTLGPEHPQLAFAYSTLAQLHQDEGDIDAALDEFGKALRIRERALGPNNPRTADMVNAIARLQLRRGNTEEGRKLLERAVRVYEVAYGPGHSKTIEGRRALESVSR